MKFFKILILLLLAISSSNCKDEKQSDYSKRTTINDQETTSSKSHLGKKLLEKNCYLCHNPNASIDSRVAPPMVAIKSHYFKNNMSKKEFGDAIWNFVEKPSNDKVKMKGAVRRFNLMPYQPYKEDDIRLIADYMFDYKIDEPEWFKQHIEEESNGKVNYYNEGILETNKISNIKTPSEIGMEYALNTKKKLGKNLMGTIQKKGTLEAVSFCNIKAYPITDSMATAQNAKIKRVSDKPRNPSNKANTKELTYISKFKNDIKAKKELKAIVETENGHTNFYYPIVTNTMCLQCHGNTTTQIEPLVLNKIKDLYPTDKAVNYDVNQVRGIWSISFDETNIK